MANLQVHHWHPAHSNRNWPYSTYFTRVFAEPKRPPVSRSPDFFDADTSRVATSVLLISRTSMMLIRRAFAGSQHRWSQLEVFSGLFSTPKLPRTPRATGLCLPRISICEVIELVFGLAVLPQHHIPSYQNYRTQDPSATFVTACYFRFIYFNVPSKAHSYTMLATIRF